MANNDLLRSIRDALKLDAATMVQIFKEAGREVGESTITSFLKAEDEDDYIPCSNPIMGFFLDGLIIRNRGKKEGGPAPDAKQMAELDNNTILKKLRIALNLKEDELIGTFRLGGIALTKHELTAMFRKPGHRHFRECPDHLLRSFIKGVSREKSS